MMDRNERVGAYVDGELAPAERAAFEAEMQTDAGLRSAVEAQRALRTRLSAAFDPVLEEPVPLALTLAAQAANEQPRRGWRPAAWGAMAACLAVGVLVGRLALPGGGPLAVRDGGLVAQGALRTALNDKLAADAGPIRIGVSFKSQDGRYCRTFQSASDHLAGLACREPGGWRAQVLAAWSPPAQPGYRTAGSETPTPVLEAMDDLIAGEPLDAGAERAARARGWRP